MIPIPFADCLMNELHKEYIFVGIIMNVCPVHENDILCTINTIDIYISQHIVYQLKAINKFTGVK